MKLVSLNYLGLFVVGASIVTFITFLTVSLDYANITHTLCNAPFCTTFTHIPPQSYAGLGLLLVTAGLGGYLTFKPKRIEKLQIIPKIKLNKIIEGLQGEQKKV